MDIKTVAIEVSKFAPLLGSALGGPVGGVVGSLIAAALGATSSSPEDILKSMQTSPDVAIKLQELQNTHKEFLISQQTQIAQLDYQDVASARQREADLAKAGDADKTPEHVIILSMGLLALVYFTSAFIEESPAQSKITLAVISVLTLIIGQGMNYLFGGGRSMLKNIGNYMNGNGGELSPPFSK